MDSKLFVMGIMQLVARPGRCDAEVLYGPHFQLQELELEGKDEHQEQKEEPGSQGCSQETIAVVV